MTRFALPIAAAVAAFVAYAALSEPPHQIAGRAHVVDGDSVEVGGARVRLFGIDAPEMQQACRTNTGAAYGCGEKARFALQQLAEGRQVSCAVKGTDRYHRALAVCAVAGGSDDLGRDMVRAGEAVVYRRGERLYDPEERDARAARRGIWAGTFQDPADFRREHKYGRED
jgi:endonuclease YncB( thermonuclease family)